MIRWTKSVYLLFCNNYLCLATMLLLLMAARGPTHVRVTLLTGECAGGVLVALTFTLASKLLLVLRIVALPWTCAFTRISSRASLFLIQSRSE